MFSCPLGSGFRRRELGGVYFRDFFFFFSVWGKINLSSREIQVLPGISPPTHISRQEPQSRLLRDSEKGDYDVES